MRKILASILLFSSLALQAQTYRDSVDVLHYGIHIYINVNKQFVQGYTDVTLRPEYDLPYLQLDLWGLLIDSLYVNSEKAADFKVLTESFRIPGQFKKHDTLVVRVYYHGNPLKDPVWGGFMFSQIDAYNYGIGMSSRPVSVGRVWFPANDIFSDKATYDFYIMTDYGQKAVCNGLLVSEKDTMVTRKLHTRIKDRQTGKLVRFDTTLTQRRKIWHWRLDLPVSTYLANVGVSDYKHKSWQYRNNGRSIPVDIYYLSSTPDSALKSFEHLDTVMKIFERLYGPYVWPRIGYLQTTSQAGAMEHATNISLPMQAVSGDLSQEGLLFHELSHSWFGNLVTCKRRQDIWLNEGWATYSEAVFRQYLYGEQSFKDFNRERHLYVLNFAHKKDGGYKAIGKIDYENTYGMTVYDKGADVVHTLRYQIGDSLFWPAVRAYLKHYAFGSATINDLKNFLEDYTGKDLDGFFDFWLYTAGFPYFEVYYFEPVKKQGKYQVAVTIHQRTVGTDTLLNGQRLELAFIGKKGKFTLRDTYVSGQWTIDTFYLDFKPELVVADPEEHVMDATTDQPVWVDSAGNYYFDYELFEMQVKKAPKEKLYFRAKANWIAPDGRFPQGYQVQRNYYWSLQFAGDKHFDADGKFYLSRLMDMNFTYLTRKQLNNLVMFYRENPYSPWLIVPSYISPQGDALIIEDLKPGDYALGLKR